MADKDIQDRLEYLRGEIEAERISQEELLELQELAEYIDPGDILLLQWAGVPEFRNEEVDDLFREVVQIGNEYLKNKNPFLQDYADKLAGILDDIAAQLSKE